MTINDTPQTADQLLAMLIPETKPSDLELARRRLRRAEIALVKAEQLVEDQGPEADCVLRLAKSELRIAQLIVQNEETLAMKSR